MILRAITPGKLEKMKNHAEKKRLRLRSRQSRAILKARKIFSLKLT